MKWCFEKLNTAKKTSDYYHKLKVHYTIYKI